MTEVLLLTHWFARGTIVPGGVWACEKGKLVAAHSSANQEQVIVRTFRVKKLCRKGFRVSVHA